MVLMAFSYFHIQENGTTGRKTNPSGRTSESRRKGSQGKRQKVIKTNSLYFPISFLHNYFIYLFLLFRGTVKERRPPTQKYIIMLYMAAVVVLSITKKVCLVFVSICLLKNEN